MYLAGSRLAQQWGKIRTYLMIIILIKWKSVRFHFSITVILQHFVLDDGLEDVGVIDPGKEVADRSFSSGMKDAVVNSDNIDELIDSVSDDLKDEKDEGLYVIYLSSKLR